MSNEELVEKIQGETGQDRCRDMETLYLQNTGLIRMVARKFKNEDKDDLLQEGYIILDRAASVYSPDGGAKFSSFLFKTLLNGFLSYKAFRGDGEKLAPYILSDIYRYRRFVSDYQRETGRKPARCDVEYFLKLPEGRYDNIMKALQVFNKRSLSDPVSDDEGNSIELSDLVPDQRNNIDELQKNIIDEEEAAIIWGAVDKLPGDEGGLIRAYYVDGKTQQELADKSGVSHSRIGAKLAHGRRMLKQNRSLQELASEKGLLTSRYYHGSLRTYLETGTSIVEYMAIRETEGWGDHHAGSSQGDDPAGDHGTGPAGA